MHQSGFKIQEVMLRLSPWRARRRESSMRGWSLKKLHQLHQKLIYLETSPLGRSRERRSQFFPGIAPGVQRDGRKTILANWAAGWKNIRISVRDRVVEMTSASASASGRFVCHIPLHHIVWYVDLSKPLCGGRQIWMVIS